MDSKDEILKSIKQNTEVRYEMPDLNTIRVTTYPDLIGRFREVMKQVGGEAILLEEGQDINELILERYPDAKSIASTLPDITCATLNPNEVATPAELNGTDLAVVDGKLGVAENGAVWVEQDVKLKAIYFISENLIILLDRNRLVSNMGQAYKEINTGPYGFGVFISGPSKTADIEQALVVGAHGARGVTVILI